MNAKAQNYNPWLHRFVLVTAAATFALLGLGGLVTSHEAGMSVPDWPTSYGYNMFALPIKFWHGGTFFEHTHRLLASAVGLLTTVLALWLFGKDARPFMRAMGFIFPLMGIASEIFFPSRWLDGILCGGTGVGFYIASFFWPRCEPSTKWLRWLGVAAFLLVMAQGILGGLRVVLSEAQLGIFHGVIGQSFFILLSGMALFTSRFWSHGGVGGPLPAPAAHGVSRLANGLRWLVLATTVLIFCQLILGATMRGQHAGLAIPDFPTAYGKIWPDTSAAAVEQYNEHRMNVVAENPITAFQINLQMVHRMVALVVLIAVVAAVLCSRRCQSAERAMAPPTCVGGYGSRLMVQFSHFWLALIFVQIGLGAATIWTNKAADVATAHVLVGALSLMTGALWCLIAFAPTIGTLGERRREARPSPSAAAPGGHPAMVGNK